MKNVKTCQKGYNCGNTCITRKKICRVTLSEKSGSSAEEFTKKIKAAKEGSSPSEAKVLYGGHNEVTPESASKLGVTPEQLTTIKQYSVGSASLRQAEAGVIEAKEHHKKGLQNIYDYLDNPKIPVYDGELYSGFREDMIRVYGSDKLKVGSEFSFPSVTSLSSDKSISDMYDGGGMFVIPKGKNKSAKTINNLTAHDGAESEVLTPKKAKYRVKSIKGTTYELEEI